MINTNRNTLDSSHSLILSTHLKISTDIDPRSSQLKDLPVTAYTEHNIFNESDYVVYYEPNYEPIINSVIHNNFKHIKETLSNKGLEFFYPGIIADSNQEDWQRVISYYFPKLSNENIPYEILTRTFTDHNLVKHYLGLNDLSGPCLIRSKKSSNDTGIEYSIFHLPIEDELKIAESISFYLLSVRPNNSALLQFSKGDRYLENRNQEEDADYLYKRISRELMAEIEKELKRNSIQGAMKIMLFLMQKMNELNMVDEIQIQEFFQKLNSSSTEEPSRLLIRTNGDIELPDFNKRIELTPLQKTVFIFFLFKEDGIHFKDLPQYRNDLMNIYTKIGNRTSISTIKSSIDALVNPYSNSMSEKCSRIREAFMKSMDERLANHYCINGERNQPKRIMLNRSLVTFEDSPF